MKEFNESNGHSANFNVSKDVDDSATRLYNRIEELFDRAWELAVPSADALSSIPSLKSAISNMIAEKGVQIQFEILSGQPLYLKGKKEPYVGQEGWNRFIQDLLGYIKLRFSEEDEEVVTIGSIEDIQAMKEAWTQMMIPLAEWDIPPLDASAAILKNWLLIICANEGVGKTALMIDTAAKLLLEQKAVLYMCGETVIPKVYGRLISSYIFHKYGRYVGTRALSRVSELPHDIQIMVNEAMLELAEARENGLLVFVTTLPYYGLYETLVSHYDKHQFDAVLIDHSKALSGGKKEYEDIGTLAIDCRNFKNRYPVFVCVASHLSSLAKELVAKEKTVDTSPTKGNSTLSGEADEVFVLYQNEKMKKENLIALMVSKTRGEESVDELVMLKFHKNVSAFSYSEEYQKGYDTATREVEHVLNTLRDEQDLDEEENGAWQTVTHR